MKDEKNQVMIVDSFVDTELEDRIIGGCLSAGREAVGELIRSNVRAECFTQKEAAYAFRALVEVYETGSAVDLVTVGDHIRDDRKGDKSEIVYMAETMRADHFGRNMAAHCEILKRLYVKRETRQYGQKLMRTSVLSEQTEILERMQEFSADLMSLSHDDDVEPLGSYFHEFERELAERMRRAQTGELAGISTGLQSMNALTNGWRKSTLNIIAGRPGMGKSALAIHFALTAAKCGKAVCIFSLEMSRKQLTERIIMAIAEGMDNDALRRGTPSARDLEACTDAASILDRLPITVLDKPECTTAYIRAESARLQKQGRCDMVVVDYLQLTEMTANVNRQYNREQQVSKASREYKILSRELDIPVLLLSQLSRAVETRADKKPMLSDLRESGSIEQDADTVTFVYRPEYYNEEGYVNYDAYGNFECGRAFAIIAKQREGATGEIEFNYDRTLTKIWDGERQPFRIRRAMEDTTPKIGGGVFGGNSIPTAPIPSPFDAAPPPSPPTATEPQQYAPFGFTDDYDPMQLPF